MSADLPEHLREILAEQGERLVRLYMCRPGLIDELERCSPDQLLLLEEFIYGFLPPTTADGEDEVQS